MDKHLTLIPGHGYHGHQYYGTIRTLEANNFIVNPLSPPWDKKVGEIVAYAQQGVDNAPGHEPILLGHSVGGNLVPIAASTTQRRLGGLIIASGGVLCANGLKYPQARESIEEMYPGQQKEIKQYEIKALAAKVDVHPSQIAVLVGEEELSKVSLMGELAQTTAEAFSTKDYKVDVTVVPGAPHIVEYSNAYIRAIVGAALNIHQAGLSQ